MDTIYCAQSCVKRENICNNNGARFQFVYVLMVLLYSGVRVPHVCVRVFTHCVHYNGVCLLCMRACTCV